MQIIIITLVFMQKHHVEQSIPTVSVLFSVTTYATMYMPLKHSVLLLPDIIVVYSYLAFLGPFALAAAIGFGVVGLLFHVTIGYECINTFSCRITIAIPALFTDTCT